MELTTRELTIIYEILVEEHLNFEMDEEAIAVANKIADELNRDRLD
jgi:hypothetical protein